MITQRVWFVVIPVAMLVAGSTACVSKTRAAQAASTPPAGQTTLTASPTVMDRLDGLTPALQPLVDVYGNEIEDAVTDYRLDTGGLVYERHSPEIEVLRLAPPLM